MIELMPSVLQPYQTPQSTSPFSIQRYVHAALDYFFTSESSAITRMARPSIYGRDESINELVTQIIEKHVASIAIVGPPFMGKTSIAREVALHPAILDRFNEHRYWIPCTNISSLEEFLNTFLKILGRQSLAISFAGGYGPWGHVLDRWKKTVLRTLAQVSGPKLLILDGFESIWDRSELRDDASRILEDICAIPQLTLLMTLRGTSPPSTVQWVYRLGPVSVDAARQIFLEQSPNPDEKLDKLLQEVDCNPTLVGVVARIAREQNREPSELLEEWEGKGIMILENLPTELKQFSSSIEHSLNKIQKSNPEYWKLLRILSMFPVGLPLAELHELAPECDVTSISKIPMLSSDTSFPKLHSPIQSYIFQFHHLNDEACSNIYSYVFTQAKKRVSQPGDPHFSENVKYLTDFGKNIEFILWDALDRQCESAIEAVVDYSSLLCSIAPNLKIMDRAAQVAERSPSKLLYARCLRALGDAHAATGSYKHSAYQTAIEEFHALGDLPSAAHCQLSYALGQIICAPGSSEGFQSLEKALRMFRASGDQRGLAQCLLKSYIHYQRKNKADTTDRKYFQEAKDIYTELGDELGLAHCAREETFIFFSREEYDKGIESLFSATATFERLGDKSMAADCHRRLGHIYSRYERGCDFLAKAIEEYRYLGRELDMAFSMKALALSYWSLGCFDKAIVYQEKAVPIFWKYIFIFGGAETRLELGMSQIAAGEIDDAILTLDISKRENQGNGVEEATTLSAALLRLAQEAESDDARLELQTILQKELLGMHSWTDALHLLPYLTDHAILRLQKLNSISY